MNKELYIRHQASKFRQTQGLSNTEPIKLKSFLLKLGVIAIFKSYVGTISGISLKIEDHRFMIINSEHTLGKQNFTICHELYHLFIQEDFYFMRCDTGLFDKKNKIEYTADLFAAYFLIPEEGILQLLPKEEIRKNRITLPTIVTLEHYFSCSRHALLIRLDYLGLIDYEKYKHFKDNVKMSAISLGQDTKLYTKGNNGLIIGDYGKKAKNLFDVGKISETHYTSLMNDIGINTEDNDDRKKR